MKIQHIKKKYSFLFKFFLNKSLINSITYLKFNKFFFKLKCKVKNFIKIFHEYHVLNKRILFLNFPKIENIKNIFILNKLKHGFHYNNHSYNEFMKKNLFIKKKIKKNHLKVFNKILFKKIKNFDMAFIFDSFNIKPFLKISYLKIPFFFFKNLSYFNKEFFFSKMSLLDFSLFNLKKINKILKILIFSVLRKRVYNKHIPYFFKKNNIINRKKKVIIGKFSKYKNRNKFLYNFIYKRYFFKKRHYNYKKKYY